MTTPIPTPDRPDDVPPDPDSLGHAVFRLARLLARFERHQPGPAFARGMHRGQGRVLALLALRAPMSQKDLAYLLGVRPQSLGELLAKLERAGLVLRTPDPTDRRSQVVELTEAGRAAAQAAGEPRDDVDDPFAVLTDDERGQLAGLLATVTDALRAADDGPRGGFGPDGMRPPFGGPRGFDRGRRFGSRGFDRGGFDRGGFERAEFERDGSDRSDHRAADHRDRLDALGLDDDAWADLRGGSRRRRGWAHRGHGDLAWGC